MFLATSAFPTTVVVMGILQKSRESDSHVWNDSWNSDDCDCSSGDANENASTNDTDDPSNDTIDL